MDDARLPALTAIGREGAVKVGDVERGIDLTVASGLLDDGCVTEHRVDHHASEDRRRIGLA